MVTWQEKIISPGSTTSVYIYGIGTYGLGEYGLGQPVITVKDPGQWQEKDEQDDWFSKNKPQWQEKVE